MLAVVLSDDETFSPMSGCTVVEVEEDFAEDNDIYEDNGVLIVEFTDEPPYLDLEGELPEDNNIFIVVLDDGERFSPLTGCSIVRLDDDYDGDDPLADGHVLVEL
jgi:hypothetical protein